VLILLAAQLIGIDELRSGIVGDDVAQPYIVLLLFFSLAYICSSVHISIKAR
jgi:hypothetical protein